MSVTIVQPVPDVATDERWRHWRLAYAESSRKTVRVVGTAFVAVVIGVVVIVVFELLSQRCR